MTKKNINMGHVNEIATEIRRNDKEDMAKRPVFEQGPFIWWKPQFGLTPLDKILHRFFSKIVERTGELGENSLLQEAWRLKAMEADSNSLCYKTYYKKIYIWNTLIAFITCD